MFARCSIPLGLVLIAISTVVAQPPETPPAEKPKAPPALPKADPKSEHVALLKDKTLYLEKKSDGGRRVLFTAEVCLNRGLLELLVCKQGTKEHEAILRVAGDVQFIHAALEAAGIKPGKPVQFINPQTMEDDYKPASGQTMLVSVHYSRLGKIWTHPAQEWILDRTTKKAMSHSWVFAGSRIHKDPDQPNAKPFYCANNGDVISISNFPDAMLELPTQIGKDDSALVYEVLPEKLPPLGSKVWVILEAAPKK